MRIIVKVFNAEVSKPMKGFRVISVRCDGNLTRIKSLKLTNGLSSEVPYTIIGTFPLNSIENDFAKAY